MSVSDPLIRDLKELTRQLYEESQLKKINDSSDLLLKTCQNLEKIFYKGLIQNHNLFYGNKRNEVFVWISSLPTEDHSLDNFNYKNSIDEVENCKNVTTYLGKFRLFVRHCLVKKCLHFVLQFNKAVLYEKTSILGDEILSQIFQSVLLQFTKINFDLDLSNSYFLDLTWEIPNLIKLQLVPCKSLGLSVSFVQNKAIIIRVSSNSVASESGEISKGDVLVTLNGIDINSSYKGRLNTILRLRKNQPVDLRIVKALKSSDVFHPLKAILRSLQIDTTAITSGQANSLQPSDDSSSSLSEVAIARKIVSGYEGIYLGMVNLGNKGGVKQIAEAINNCIRRSSDDSKKSVLIEAGEMNVKIVDVKTGQVFLKHSYMQISACGTAPKLPNYIAYIAGETSTCDTSDKFDCFVFYLERIEDAVVILQTIGQGFHRTHFAV